MNLEGEDFDVLHAVALRKRSDAEGVARATGFERAMVDAALARGVETKLLLAAARGTFLVAPDGDRELREAYPERFAACRADAAFVAAYDRFETVNREVKDVVTRWQMRPVCGASVPNDHSDAGYDESVLDRLSAAHEHAEPVLGALARVMPRLARYAERLESALARAEGGESEWVSGVRCDSYHTVWFELHEDLLRILGRARRE